jgi:multidrug efflux system membrane fusion protein
VQVKSLVDGQLLRVNYREGELVREGDLLAEIDPRPFEAQLMQFEGEYERDKAQLDNALIDLKRYEASYARKAIPEQQLATQRATVLQDQGTVKLDQGQIANTKLELLYCHITAPISGRVGLRLVDPGNIVHTTDSNALLVLTQVRPITVIFNLAEDYLPQVLPQLRQGHPLEVGAYDRAWNTLLATGSVLALDNQIDPSTGTLRVRAVFTNDDNTLFPNQFVNAKLRLGTRRGATLVPAEAVQRNTQGAYLFVVQTNQTIALRPVEVHATEDNQAAVEGVQPGEIIATDNFNRLQEGTRIEAQPAPSGTNNNSNNSALGGPGP